MSKYYNLKKKYSILFSRNKFCKKLKFLRRNVFIKILCEALHLVFRNKKVEKSSNLNKTLNITNYRMHIYV